MNEYYHTKKIKQARWLMGRIQFEFLLILMKIPSGTYWSTTEKH